MVTDSIVCSGWLWWVVSLPQQPGIALNINHVKNIAVMLVQHEPGDDRNNHRPTDAHHRTY